MAAHMLPRSTPTELQSAGDGLIHGVRPPRRAGFRLSDHPNVIRATTVGAVPDRLGDLRPLAQPDFPQLPGRHRERGVPS